MASPPRLELRGISKQFAATRANDAVDLVVRPGEIHALLGENGAGKTTLVKIIYGVLKPDSGSLWWDGHQVDIASPNAARQLGIGMVFQHFSLFESLSVLENIALGLGTQQALPALAARVVQVAQRYGLAVDPHRAVHHLSVGERQRVEILRCLLQQPRLLIMDEPTSVLTPQEVGRLFDMLRRLAAEGCSILYISHKLEEIQALCHAVTVLRAGRVSGHCDPRQETPATMAELMIGSPLRACRRAMAPAQRPVCLSVAGLSLKADTPFGTDLHDIRLDVRAGEILGIAGVAGNGQKELLAALSGERLARQPDDIRIDHAPAGRLGVGGRRRLGLAFIPEERLGRGAVAGMSLLENALLTRSQTGLVALGFVRFAALRRFAAFVFGQFRVVAAGIDADAASLSGGNMQKFIVGREMGGREMGGAEGSPAPRVLLAAHPTWGVDIGAAMAIREALIALAEAGAAVLVVSEDIAELFEITDRIAVLNNGRLSLPTRTADTGIEAIGLLMGGMAEEAGHGGAAGAVEMAHVPAA